MTRGQRKKIGSRKSVENQKLDGVHGRSMGNKGKMAAGDDDQYTTLSDSDSCLLSEAELENSNEHWEQVHKKQKSQTSMNKENKTRKSKRKRSSTGDSTSGMTGETIDYSSLSNDDKLSLILSKMNANETRMKSLNSKLDFALHSSGTRLNSVEKNIETQNHRIKVLEYKSIDLEARSRRKNLLFYGFGESRGESCVDTISEFLKSKMSIQEEIVIDRAHRLGKFKITTVRPIIVAFRDYASTERIMSATPTLSGSSIGVKRDFPPEITKARKELWPHYKHLKSQNPKSAVKIQFPAKLVMEGKTIRDMFPEWSDIINTPRVHINTNKPSTTSPVNSARAHVVKTPSQQTVPNTSPLDTQTTWSQPSFRPWDPSKPGTSGINNPTPDCG